MKINSRGIPSASCISCGSTWFNVPVTFDPETYFIAAWGTKALCYSCNVEVTVPTPADHPNWESNRYEL